MPVRKLVCVVITLAFVGFLISTIDSAKAKEIILRSSAKEKNRGPRLDDDNVAPAAIFTNSSPITINAVNNATPYPSSIVVSGLSGNIPVTPGSVKVTINGFSHAFTPDVGIVLVGPTGAAYLLHDAAGFGSAMSNVTYTLSDTGVSQLPSTTWVAGTYRPANYDSGNDFPSPGPGLAYASPGPTGGGTATFASVFGGTAPNGTWNLFVRDFFTQNGGSIVGGWSIEITTAAANDAPVDFNGDGKTDYVVARNTGGGSGGQETWFVQNNATGGMSSQAWGISTDQFIPSDYDGDGKDDYAVWRSAAQAAFYIINSGTNTIRVSNCGITGDNPTVVGDYNNDGKDDVAVYRAGASAGNPSTWYWRPNDTVDFTAVVHGQNGDFVAPGDYDGDGKQDFAVQRNAGGGNANFIIKFAAGGADQTILFGAPTDLIAPGDYDGDGKTDLCVVRSVGGFLQWTYRRSIDAASVVDTWGISASDFVAQGDYNGDGKTDYGVWRTGAQGEFFAMTPVTRQISSRQWGITGDTPVANYNTH
jgi:subtilisin-like proprotein convertase family protein